MVLAPGRRWFVDKPRGRDDRHRSSDASSVAADPEHVELLAPGPEARRAPGPQLLSWRHLTGDGRHGPVACRRTICARAPAPSGPTHASVRHEPTDGPDTAVEYRFTGRVHLRQPRFGVGSWLR